MINKIRTGTNHEHNYNSSSLTSQCVLKMTSQCVLKMNLQSSIVVKGSRKLSHVIK